MSGNTFRSSKTDKKKRSKPAISPIKWQGKLGDERFPKLIGLLMLLSSLYLFVAFFSYLFTWWEDQDVVNRFRGGLIWESDLEVSNWLGRLGAIVSHQFFYWWFGLMSFVFVPVLFMTGTTLIRQMPLRSMYRLYRYAIFGMLWGSVLLAFVFGWSGFPWGGAVGQLLVNWLSSFLGWIGVVVFLFFSFAAIVIWNKNPNMEDLTFDRILSDLRDLFNVEGFLQAYKSRDTELDEEDEDAENERLPDVNKMPISVAQALIHEEEMPPPPGDPRKPELAELARKARELTQNQLSLEVEPSIANPQINNVATDELEIVAPEAVAPVFEPDPMVENLENIEEVTENNLEHLEPYDPTLDLPSYEHPVLALLEEYNQQVVIDRSELEANKDQIINTLLHYKIEITKIKATIGPTVTLYEIIPSPGVRISKIKNLEDDIALSLAALGIRIIAPIPGKGTIGIEVPNRNKQMVALKEVLESDKFKRAKMDLPIALGKSISNEVFVADLARMPHLLVAGATGQGKSVGINAILMSLLYKKHPSQLKLILIDPKKVELSPYNQIDHHFLGCLPSEEEAIITDTSRVIQTLHSLTIEMDERYNLLKKAGVRNLTEYNHKFVSRRLNPDKGHRFMPYIVLVIDEFADLIMTAGKEVELPIGRLAQLARAVGIHLIIATQRPSVNIITGVIKANFPARLAFKVASKIDSRTILDAGGAEQLVGRGDMLLSVGGDMIRLQCAFVDTPEVERVVEFIHKQKGYPEPWYLPDYSGPDGDASAHDTELKKTIEELDEYFEDSARLVVIHQSGSTSMIQRRLKLGYNRAGRIMDQLEALGVVGPNEGSKPREVHFQDEVELEKYLKIVREKYG